MPGAPTIVRIVLEVTLRCPRRCPFCYLGPSSHRSHEAPPDGEPPELPAPELAGLVIALAKESGCEAVQLSGGEPLLYRDLPELIARLIASGLGVSLLTDGALLDETRARALARLGVGTIQPTLLSGTPELHDALRGEGAFLGATHAIAAASAAGLPVSVSYVITATNAAPAVARGVAELAFALGARTLALGRFCPTGAASGAARLLPTPSQVREAAIAAAAACRRLGLSCAAAIPIPACVFPDPLRPPLPIGACALLATSRVVTVSPDGSLRSCSLSTRRAGNLREEPWEIIAERLWADELAPIVAAVPAPCQGCPAWERCRGGCRLSALAATGRPDGMDPIAPPTGFESKGAG
ncbi:MAG: radical SAM protein [Polyangia bacterium]|jgi:pyrroloquinoline quinone biosynthesis protein E|nr:radical SAM protein [Polyangia bacterium]